MTMLKIMIKLGSVNKYGEVIMQNIGQNIS